MKKRLVLAGASGLCALMVGMLVVGVSRAGPLPACTADKLVPQFGDVTINQGVGSYTTGNVARGKETLVRFYLTLPTEAGTTCSGSINVTAATMTVTSSTGPATFSTPAYQSFGSSGSAISASTVTVDENADPKFVIPGQFMNHCLVDITSGASCTDTSFFPLTFSADVTYTTSASSTPTHKIFSTFKSGASITANVDRKTNALRILVVPMGDASLGRTSQFSSSAQQAVVNGISTLSRLYPVEFGVSNDIAVATGGLRYTVDPGLLNLRSVAGTYDPNGKFCGTSSNFNGIKGLLDTFLNAYNSNIANAGHPADKVLGVVDSAISDGSTSTYNCAEGMAATSNTSNTSIAATEAWVRAIPDVAATKSQPAQPSMTGSLMAMEIAHTMAQELVTSTNLTYHSLNTNADLLAPDRGYNVSMRSYVAGPHSAMRFVTPWNNNNTDMEANDFESLLCNLGGSTLSGIEVCTSPSIGGTPSPAASSFMISGTTDFTPDGTHVVESFAASGTPPTASDDSSDLRLKFFDFNGTLLKEIGIPYSTGTSVHDSNLAGHIDNRAAVFGGVFDAPTGIGNVQLVKSDGTVLYSRTAQATAPSVTPDGFAPGDTVTGGVKYTTAAVPPNPDIMFLGDTTSSMTDAISAVQGAAGNVMSTVLGSQPSAEFGAAEFKDACELDNAFKLNQKITTSTTNVQAGMNAWAAGGQACNTDAAEDWLNALYQLSGNSDLIGTAGWRSVTNGTRIVVLFGDSSSHDPSNGYTKTQVTNAMTAAKIRLVAVPIDNSANSNFLSDHLDNAGQATSIANATGGTVQPEITAANLNGTTIANSILAGLSNLVVTVTPSATCDTGLSISFSPSDQKVASGSETAFNYTITVESGATAGSTLKCRIHMSVDGNPDDSFGKDVSVKIRTNTIAFTATAPDLSVLTAHINYDCGNGEQIPLAVGLTPTVSGDTASFSYTYTPSPICPGKYHDATITPVVTNGIQTSSTTFTTHVETAHQPPVAAIYTPVDADAPALSPFPLSGLVTDPDDGILVAHWQITDPGGLSKSADGNKVDVAPPAGGWPPGDYTITLTGTDSDGNTATATRHVAVVQYQFGGFLSPVDNPPTVNTGSAGKTYPVKFSLLSLPSLTVVTDLSVVTAVRYTQSGCGLDPTDALETTATGSTSLRNDGTQYIYNWATPSKPGCYTLMITLDDGTTHVAWFQLK